MNYVGKGNDGRKDWLLPLNYPGSNLLSKLEIHGLIWGQPAEKPNNG